MWTYEQATGRMLHYGKLEGIGYAGKGEGKNNPEMQDVHKVGPLPRGIYSINAPIDTASHGPYVMWLTPDACNDMCGRSAFGIHGDSKSRPGDASEGCIAIALAVRRAIWESDDHTVEVV